MTKLKDLLAAAKSRSLLLDQQRQLQEKVASVTENLKLNPARRAENLRLLRAYMDAHQDTFVSMLDIGSQSLYSKMKEASRN